MSKYQRRETYPTKILQGKKPVYVSNYHDLLERLPTINLKREVLCLDQLPILGEEYYVSGDQTPLNRFAKHAPTLKLLLYDSIGARNDDQQPFYRERREAFTNLHQERAQRLKEGDEGLVYLAGLSWRPSKNEDPRIVTLVSALKGLEGFLISYHAKSPLQKIRISPKYSPHQSMRQGVKVKFCIPSVTGEGWYTMEGNTLHNVASYNDSNMYSVMSRIWSSHMCGEKDNLLLRFGDIGDEDRPIRTVPLCQHDIQALLQFMYESQIRLRSGENIDSVYDPLERTEASIPMFLNPILLATPVELHDFRVLYHNTLIRRPKRNKQKGGFLRDPKGNIVYDEWKPLWEAEIEPIMWTRISDLGRDAMFVRQKIVDLPFFEK